MERAVSSYSTTLWQRVESTGDTGIVGSCTLLEFDLAEQASGGGDIQGDKGKGGGRNTVTHAIDHLNGGFERHTTAVFSTFI